MDKVANLQAYLKQVGMQPLSGATLKDAKDTEYLVLYAARDNKDEFSTAHAVKDLHTAECMVAHEIYVKVRVISLSDSSIVQEKERHCPCHNPSVVGVP
jgi:hypothetical protein